MASLRQQSVQSQASFDPSVASNASWDPSDEEEYDPSSDDEVSQSSASPPQKGTSPSSSPVLTPASGQVGGGGGGGPGGGMEHRRERSEISVLKAELERQRLQNRDLEEENRNLKKREEKAAWDRSELERQQVARNADLVRVREARDQEIQHRKNSDTRLLVSERKLADQEKAFRKVKDNLNHRLAAAVDKEREMATTIRRLERIEADLHKRLEEEQEESKALAAAHDAAHAETRAKEQRVRELTYEVEIQKEKYSLLNKRMENTDTEWIEWREEMGRNFGLEKERLESVVEQLRDDKVHLEQQVSDLKDEQSMGKSAAQAQQQLEKEGLLSRAQVAEHALREKEHELDETMRHLQAQKEEVGALQAQVSGLMKEQEESVAAAAAAKDQLEAATKERDEAVHKLRATEAVWNQSREFEGDAGRLHSQQELMEKMEQLKAAVETKDRQLDAFTSEKSELESDLQTERHARAAGEVEAEAKLRTAQQDLEAMRAVLEREQGAKEAALAQLESMRQNAPDTTSDARVTELNQALARSEDDIDRLRKDKAEKEREVAELECSSAQLLKELESARAQITSHDAGKDAALATAQQKAEALTSRVSELEASLEAAGTREEALSTEKHARESEADKLRTELQIANFKLSQMREDNCALEAQLQTIAAMNSNDNIGLQRLSTDSLAQIAPASVSHDKGGTGGVPFEADLGPAARMGVTKAGLGGEGAAPKGAGLGFTFKRDSRTGNWQVNRIKEGGFAARWDVSCTPANTIHTRMHAKARARRLHPYVFECVCA